MKFNKAKSGSIVVLDSRNGEVLALANWPTYNPNDRRTFRPERWRNRAIVDKFEPGSTLKPFTVAAAIDSGYYEVDSLINVGTGKLRIGNNTISDTISKD